jgi:hypothetical protein
MFARFQASAAMEMRSAVFWDITQNTMVIPYRRFWTSYRYYIQGTLEDGTDRLSRNVGKELPLYAA